MLQKNANQKYIPKNQNPLYQKSVTSFNFLKSFYLKAEKSDLKREDIPHIAGS